MIPNLTSNPFAPNGLALVPEEKLPPLAQAMDDIPAPVPQMPAGEIVAPPPLVGAQALPAGIQAVPREGEFMNATGQQPLVDGVADEQAVVNVHVLAAPPQAVMQQDLVQPALRLTLECGSGGETTTCCGQCCAVSGLVILGVSLSLYACCHSPFAAPVGIAGGTLCGAAAALGLCQEWGCVPELTYRY